MTKRKSISKKIRFEVLKRDLFTCQYCGRQAPEVILEIDHIKPVFDGGDNSIFNLITSCYDCNHGKGKRKLSDNSEITKQKNELNKIQAKKEQLNDLRKWRESLKTLEQETLDFFNDVVEDCCNHEFTLNENGLIKLKKYINKYEKKELIEAINLSFEAYYKPIIKNNEKEGAFSKALNYIPRILTSIKEQKDNPNLKNVYYCRKILKNNLHYVNDWQAKNILNELLEKYTFESVKDLCCKVNNWTAFIEVSNDWLGE